MDPKIEELYDTTIKAHDILLTATTVFPFVLFPDTITIDREKVTIANRYFFQVARITSSPIQDLQSVEANLGPFFGSVRMTSRFFFKNIRVVKFLWRDDAIKIQRLLQGYIIVRQKGIDCSDIEKEQLVTLLMDLGKGTTD